MDFVLGFETCGYVYSERVGLRFGRLALLLKCWVYSRSHKVGASLSSRPALNPKSLIRNLRTNRPYLIKGLHFGGCLVHQRANSRTEHIQHRMLEALNLFSCLETFLTEATCCCRDQVFHCTRSCAGAPGNKLHACRGLMGRCKR